MNLRDAIFQAAQNTTDATAQDSLEATYQAIRRDTLSATFWAIDRDTTDATNMAVHDAVHWTTGDSLKKDLK